MCWHGFHFWKIAGTADQWPWVCIKTISITFCPRLTFICTYVDHAWNGVADGLETHRHAKIVFASSWTFDEYFCYHIISVYLFTFQLQKLSSTRLIIATRYKKPNKHVFHVFKPFNLQIRVFIAIFTRWVCVGYVFQQVNHSGIATYCVLFFVYICVDNSNRMWHWTRQDWLYMHKINQKPFLDIVSIDGILTIYIIRFICIYILPKLVNHSYSLYGIYGIDFQTIKCPLRYCSNFATHNKTNIFLEVLQQLTCQMMQPLPMT